MVTFTIDGRPALAEEGTTVAAALWNAGVFASRRAGAGDGRFGICGMGICHECTVRIDGRPARGCMVRVAEGMEVATDA